MTTQPAGPYGDSPPHDHPLPHDHSLPAAGSASLVPSHVAPGAASVVRLADVTAGYDGRAAIEHVSLDIPAGSLVAILGPNCGGKSTALKVIAGLLRPWDGTVQVLGAPAGREAHRVAYVPQAEAVDWSFPVTVWDVVMMGRYPRLGPVRRAGPADRDAVAGALGHVGMADRAQTQIGSLSGGQRRRAFLARAIAADPELYLLDEPVTGVDVGTQEDLMGVLDDEARRGKTIVATTHDLAAAAHHFDRLIAINRTVIASGSSAEVLASDVLARIYGGHLVVLGGHTLLLDDAHHHDTEAPGEPGHHHDEERTRR
jgi:manganese/iron transport system ATP-binding protein